MRAFRFAERRRISHFEHVVLAKDKMAKRADAKHAKAYFESELSWGSGLLRKDALEKTIQSNKSPRRQLNLPNWVSALAAIGTLGLAYATWRTSEDVKSVRTVLSNDLKEKERNLDAAIKERDSKIAERNRKIDNQDESLRISSLQRDVTQSQVTFAQQKLMETAFRLTNEERELQSAIVERSLALNSSATIRLENKILQRENSSLGNETRSTLVKYERIVLSLVVEDLFNRPSLVLNQLIDAGEDLVDSSIDVRGLVLAELNREKVDQSNPGKEQVLNAVQTRCNKVPSEVFEFRSIGTTQSDSPRQTKAELLALNVSRQIVAYYASLAEVYRESGKFLDIPPRSLPDKTVTEVSPEPDRPTASNMSPEPETLAKGFDAFSIAPDFAIGFSVGLRNVPADWTPTQKSRSLRLQSELSETRGRIKACVLRHFGLPETPILRQQYNNVESFRFSTATQF